MGFITIIGAGPGISYGVARKFGKDGFRIGLIAPDESRLKELAANLEGEGVDAIYAVGDAGDAASLKNALFSIRDRAGHADMILYNAAAGDRKDLLEEDWETVKKALDVSIGGAFHLLKLVLPFCIQNNKGKLFFTGGGSGLSGDPQRTAGSIGKAGMRNLVQAAQKKVAGTPVHIAQVTVCGFVQPADPKYNTTAIAEEFWRLFHQQPGEYDLEIIY